MKKKSIFVGFISFDMSFRKDFFLHLGHCYFIKLVDMLIQKGIDVYIYICSATSNFFDMDVLRYENYEMILAKTLKRWEHCFNGVVKVINIGQYLRENNFGNDLWQNEITIYLSRIERTVNVFTNSIEKYCEILNALELWRKTWKMEDKYLSIIEQILEVFKTENKQKKISKNEIIAMAFVLFKKPKWYSQEWMIQFIQFYNQMYMRNDRREILIIESKRNAYTWLALSFLSKKMGRKFPQMQFFRNVPDVEGKCYMKSSEKDKCISSENYMTFNYNLLPSALKSQIIELFDINGDLESYIKDIISNCINRLYVE